MKPELEPTVNFTIEQEITPGGENFREIPIPIITKDGDFRTISNGGSPIDLLGDRVTVTNKLPTDEEISSNEGGYIYIHFLPFNEGPQRFYFDNDYFDMMSIQSRKSHGTNEYHLEISREVTGKYANLGFPPDSVKRGFLPGEDVFEELGVQEDGAKIRIRFFDSRPAKLPDAPPLNLA